MHAVNKMNNTCGLKISARPMQTMTFAPENARGKKSLHMHAWLAGLTAADFPDFHHFPWGSDGSVPRLGATMAAIDGCAKGRS
jgi:hypothetical protein